MPSAAATDDRNPRFEVPEDLVFQRRAWRTQATAWVVAIGIGVAAAVGLFGNGLLSEAEVTSGDGLLTVRHQLFGRHGANDAIEVDVAPVAASTGQVVLLVDRSWLAGLDLQWVLPEPQEVASSGDRLRYVFGVGDRAATTTIVFEARYGEVGLREGHVVLEASGSTAAVRQFVYP
jgi:hypothetical protein